MTAARDTATQAGTRRKQWLAACLLLVLALLASGDVAWSFWTGAGDTVHGPGAAGAATVDQGASPNVERTGAAAVTLTWGAATLSDGTPVGGYLVRRYSASTGTEQTVGSGCSGTLTLRTCTETGLPDGVWRYTVTPVIATHWRGPASIASGAISSGPVTLTIATSLFGGPLFPLPSSTTGSMAGFLPGEGITYRVDGTTVTGAPSAVGESGGASISAVTIPALADGPHTLTVTGTTSGLVASTGVLVDSTPPALTVHVNPAANAAGWNNTPVEVVGTADDGDSGISYVRFTTDGTDPRTSPTAQFYYGEPVLNYESKTIKYYGVDFAGNASPVETLVLKIDIAPPAFNVSMTAVTGGAYVAAGSGGAPGIVYYRGAAAGSFRFRATPIEDGGAPAASLGTSALTDVATGFAHEPSVSATPEGDGSFVTNPFSWVAGTSSTPIGTLTLTDAAGNATVASGTMHNDSTAPAGGSVEATGLVGAEGRYTLSKTIHLALATGTDAGSGLNTSASRLLRASATLASPEGVTNGVCGTYGAYVQVGTEGPATAATDTVPADELCYRYEYQVPDHVGNIVTYTSGDIKVDELAPPSLTPSAVTITPLTGLSAQFVAGSTIYYKPALAGTFSVAATATDAESGVTSLTFPSFAGFAGGGVVLPQGIAAPFHMTYSWSSNAASGSPGPQTLLATDNAGMTATLTGAFSVLADVTAPTNTLALTSATGSYLSGSTLYYNSNNAGSFKLSDTIADSGSGPASITYPALLLSGWSHANETIPTPTAGTYPSSTFSWSSHPSSPSTYTVSSQDNLANTATTAVTFVSDQSPPSGGSITYTNGIVKSASVAISTTTGTDTQSGVNPGSAIVRRDTTSLDTATDTCGTFPGTYATTVALVGGADTSVSNAHCYQYRYFISDNVGNQATYPSGNIVKLDTAPKVTSIVSQQSGGTAGNGQLQVGDRLVLTFDEELSPASVPAMFTGATEARVSNEHVRLSIPGFTNGAVDTGSAGYLSGSTSRTATFAGTAALLNSGAGTTVTITVTSLTGSTTTASSGPLKFATATTITGLDGTPATGTFSTSSGFKLF